MQSSDKINWVPISRRRTGRYNLGGVLIRPDELLYALTRRWLRITVVTTFFGISGLLLWSFIPSQFTAFGKVILEDRPLSFWGTPSTTNTREGLDESKVEDRIQLVLSDRIAQKVIYDLKLDANLQLNAPFWLDELRAYFMPAAISGSSDKNRRTAREIFRQGLHVERIGRSHTLRIGFSTIDPFLAADVANSTIDAFASLQPTFPASPGPALQEQIRNRIVATRALPPARPDGPSKKVVVVISAMLGFIAASLFTVGRQFFDGTIKTTTQLSEVTGLFCWGILPLMSPKPGALPVASRSQKEVKTRESGLRIQEVAWFTRLPQAGALGNIAAMLDQMFAEDRTVVIGIISTIGQEGTSTVALNLARLLSETTLPTLLIDCHFRRPKLTLKLTPDVKAERGDGFNQGERWSHLVRQDRESALHFLPANLDVRSSASPGESNSGTSPVVESIELVRWIQTKGDSYKWIILDLPPILPMGDCLSVAKPADALILVTEWGKTPADLIAKGLSNLGPFRDKFVGAVMNKVDLAILARLDSDANILYGQSDTVATDGNSSKLATKARSVESSGSRTFQS